MIVYSTVEVKMTTTITGWRIHS